MPMSDSIPSSPPGSTASMEESLKFYKAQYELMETELADFQSSSKELEAELERDIEAKEKRERQLKDKANNLQYEVDEWKEKYKQAKTESGAAQNRLQREVTELRGTNRTLELRLRDIEVVNDDYERQQRNTASSLEDMEAKYNQAFERTVILEQEVQAVEQERESLRIDVQRLRDEFQDFRIEAEITKERLRKADEALKRQSAHLSIDPDVQSSISPRSELSPTTTNTSSPSFDTPPAKIASASGLCAEHTPPSPPTSETSAPLTKPTPSSTLPTPRASLHATPTPRQATHNARISTSLANGRGPSSAVAARKQPGSAFRQSLSRSTATRPLTIPQSSSIMQLRSLRGKMQNLEERVQRARSKLPAPIHTPERASPRSGSALDNHAAIPSSITMRNRKRTVGSQLSDHESQSTPSVARRAPSRASLSQSTQSAHQAPAAAASPSRGTMLPPRPTSRTSGVHSRQSGFIPSHSRPGSRVSISNLRAPLGAGVDRSKFLPNASTDRISRPQSALSSYDGTRDLDDDVPAAGDESLLEDATEGTNYDNTYVATPTPRRSITSRSRTSDFGMTGGGAGSPTKRTSLGGGGISRLPGPVRRQSQSQLATHPSMRTPSRSASRASMTEENAVFQSQHRPSSRAALGDPATGSKSTGVAEAAGDIYDLNQTF